MGNSFALSLSLLHQNLFPHQYCICFPFPIDLRVLPTYCNWAFAISTENCTVAKQLAVVMLLS